MVYRVYSQNKLNVSRKCKKSKLLHRQKSSLPHCTFPDSDTTKPSCLAVLRHRDGHDLEPVTNTKHSYTIKTLDDTVMKQAVHKLNDRTVE